MASVFLSYDREDAPKARPIALALERAGHSVWWDRHIKGGSEFSREIEQALTDADAVVVLWSERSVQSPWVRDEAAAGRDTRRLVPVALDTTMPPLGFRQYQAVDLTGTKPRRAHISALNDAIAAVASAEKLEPPKAAPIAEPRSWRSSLIGAVLALAALVGLFFWRPWQAGASVPVVAVVPADQNPASGAMVRDLIVQLGKLQGIEHGALKLVASRSESPDVVLEVSASQQTEEARAGVTLFGGKDRALLWSRDFTQPRGREADLRQQIAFSAAQVLQCTAEATSAGVKLPAGVRKLYLNSCSEFGDVLGTGGGTRVLAALERVTRNAPRFRDPWAKLLLIESEIENAGSETSGDTDVKASLRRHIEQARKLHPNLPEILLAQLPLMPNYAFAERLRLVDRAKEIAPDNPHVLALRSIELQCVGRMAEAVGDAERASVLNPLSPAMRNAFISALAYSGRLNRAEEALKEAERLWPGTSTILDIQSRYHLRYGDPRVALDLLNKHGTGRLHEATLLARIDRTPDNIERAVSLATTALNRYQFLSGYLQVMAEFGREDEIYAALARGTPTREPGATEVFFRPTLKKFREDRRFMALAKRFGLIDYWQKSGKWPDFCAELDLPYDCKAEAAKLAA